MVRYIKRFLADLREFKRSMLALKHSPVGHLSLGDTLYLAAVALELGVGVQEARDGSWRQRFSVVDE